MLLSSIVKCLFPAAGLDYVKMSQVVTFVPPSVRWCVRVLLIDDGDVEGNEVFSVRLSNREETAVTLNPRTASVRIIDEDGKVTKLTWDLRTSISFSIQLSVQEMCPSPHVESMCGRELDLP